MGLAKHGEEVSGDRDACGAGKEALEAGFGKAETGRLDWIAQTTVSVDEDTAGALFKLLDVLDDCDGVQRVSGAFGVTDEVMERLSA